jgi:hypothetical protein
MAYAVGRDVALDALVWTAQRPGGLMVSEASLYTPRCVGHHDLTSPECCLSAETGATE